MFHQWNAEDTAAVDGALDATNTVDIASRPVHALSGGQRQRVWIAMAPAQQTSILLLDEPTTFLDIAHQMEVLELLVDCEMTSAALIVLVLHDINQAARFSDHLVVMQSGSISAQGTPKEVITREIIHDAFGVETLIMSDPVTGTPMMVPIGRQSPTLTK